MAVKYTVQGLLIYVTLAAYLLAFVTMLAGRRKAGQTLFVAGFLAAATSFVYRWFDVRHVPLQNLFEVFLFLGAVCYPISWFCRRILRIGGQWADMLIGAVVLVPGGLRLQRPADAASAGPAKLAVRPARGGLHAGVHLHGQGGRPGSRPA